MKMRGVGLKEGRKEGRKKGNGSSDELIEVDVFHLILQLSNRIPMREVTFTLYFFSQNGFLDHPQFIQLFAPPSTAPLPYIDDFTF